MIVSTTNPWRKALRRDRLFPSCVLGPVLLSALRRLASICLAEVIGNGLLDWVRFVM
jgi:hypothetical protein